MVNAVGSILDEATVNRKRETRIKEASHYIIVLVIHTVAESDIKQSESRDTIAERSKQEQNKGANGSRGSLSKKLVP